MKVKIKDLVSKTILIEGRPTVAFTAALEALKKEKLSVPVAFKLIGINKTALVAIEDFLSVRNKRLEELQVEGVLSKENEEIFVKEVNQILEKEIELETLSKDELADVKITADYLEVLEPILV